MLHFLLSSACVALGNPDATRDGQQSVRVVVELHTNGAARLLRDGQPHFVNGVGLDKGSIAGAAAAGANSVRTWGSDELGKILDEAQRHQMTVCAGIWLGHERHGFRYDDPMQVARQKEMVRRVVEEHKNHPALLVWGLGNEMEGDGHNPKVWEAIEDIAQMVKSIDSGHPTMTVISEFGDDPTKIRSLHETCEHIDIIGLNSYSPVDTLAARYSKFGGKKPYLVTEFGPRGWWESKRTDWGAPLEPTSTEKAKMYRTAYESSILGQPKCLGSYAFLWGWKQEATATWFGLVLPTGEKVGAVDELTQFWTGKPPANRCPVIGPFALEGERRSLPGSTLRVGLQASDPDGDTAKATWELQAEGAPKGGGDAEPEPKRFPAAIVESDASHAIVKLPDKPGAYRLFVTVRDGQGGAATANLPLNVTN